MITLWHNPRCSKSRQALAILEDAQAAVQIRRYLDDVPTIAELTAACAAIGVAPINMIRKSEPVFKELGLTVDTPDVELIAAMAAHPILIERPIAFRDVRAVIGRPPEAVKALL